MQFAGIAPTAGPIPMSMFFNGWIGLGRVLVVGICTYAALVLMLRVSGRRTLSKMYAFDFVVDRARVHYGDGFALEGHRARGRIARAPLAHRAAMGGASLAVHFSAWRKLIKSDPRLLALRGELIESALVMERVTAEGVYAALRSSGHASLTEVEAVVLEADGSLSVITSSPDQREATAPRGVAGFVGGGSQLTALWRAAVQCFGGRADMNVPRTENRSI